MHPLVLRLYYFFRGIIKIQIKHLYSLCFDLLPHVCLFVHVFVVGVCIFASFLNSIRKCEVVFFFHICLQCKWIVATFRTTIKIDKVEKNEIISCEK